jgi:hypothetical protein
MKRISQCCNAVMINDNWCPACDRFARPKCHCKELEEENKRLKKEHLKMAIDLLKEQLKGNRYKERCDKLEAFLPTAIDALEGLISIAKKLEVDIGYFTPSLNKAKQLQENRK